MTTTPVRLLCCLIAAFMLRSTAAAAESDIRIAREWGELHGTLAVPESGSATTAVVIIAGSGPTDRNGNSSLGLQPRSYAMLSDALCRAGFAVLRYDKRAIGRSVYPSERIADLTFDDYIDDAAACVEYLRSEGYERVVPVGHSEGALIAGCVAARCDVDGAVLLSGAGYRLDIILNRQLASQLMAVDMGLMVRATAILNRLASGRMADDIPPELQPLFGRHIQPFLISCMRYDPVETIRGIDAPILIVTGGADIQITPDNAHRLHEAAPESRLVLLDAMSHVLKDCASTDRMEQLFTVYADSTLPLSAGLADAVIEFLTTI